LLPFKEFRLAQLHKYSEHVIREAAVINGTRVFVIACGGSGEATEGGVEIRILSYGSSGGKSLLFCL